MTDRPIKPEEKKVWGRVARTVRPRRRPHGHKAAKPYPLTGPSREEFANMLRVPPQRSEVQRPLPQSLDVNRDKGVRRGKVSIDSKIDLHDLTQAQAKPALQRSIIRASNRNYKCLLVITGKGTRGDGILRRSFVGWIEDPTIRPFIATYAQAHIRHGGSGAWYVFLKS